MVNVANGKQISISEVAETVCKVIGTEKKVKFNGAERKGDPINWEADIEVIKRWGYQSSVELEDGVRKYITWIYRYDPKYE